MCGYADFKKIVTLLDLCVSSLRRGHANLLCIVPILTDGNPEGNPILLRFHFRYRIVKIENHGVHDIYTYFFCRDLKLVPSVKLNDQAYTYVYHTRFFSLKA